MKSLFNWWNDAAQSETGVADRFVSHHALLDRWSSFSATPLKANAAPKSAGEQFGWRKGVKLADEQFMV
jgi:hypothetical protein